MNAPNEKTMFPRVRSYRSDYSISNLMHNIDFEGGIGMMGNQVDVFGGVDNKAIFHFRQGGREVLNLSAGGREGPVAPFPDVDGRASGVGPRRHACLSDRFVVGN